MTSSKVHDNVWGGSWTYSPTASDAPSAPYFPPSPDEPFADAIEHSRTLADPLNQEHAKLSHKRPAPRSMTEQIIDPSARFLLAPQKGLSRSQIVMWLEATARKPICLIENTDLAASQSIRKQIEEVRAQGGTLVLMVGPGGVENPAAFHTLIDNYGATGKPGERASDMRVVAVLPEGVLLEDTAFVSRFRARIVTHDSAHFPALPWTKPSAAQLKQADLPRVVAWETMGLQERLEKSFRESKGTLLVSVPEPSQYTMDQLILLARAYPNVKLYVHEGWDGYVNRRRYASQDPSVLFVDESNISSAFARGTGKLGQSCLGPLADLQRPAPRVRVIGPLSDASWQMLASAPNACWPPDAVEGVPVPAWAMEVSRVQEGERKPLTPEFRPTKSCVIVSSEPALAACHLLDALPIAQCVGIASDTSVGALLQSAGRNVDGQPVLFDTPLLEALRRGGDIILRMDHARELAQGLGSLLLDPPCGLIWGRIETFSKARVIVVSNDPLLLSALPACDVYTDPTIYTPKAIATEVLRMHGISEKDPDYKQLIVLSEQIHKALQSDPETLARGRRFDAATMERLLAHRDVNDPSWMKNAIVSTLSGEFGDRSEAYAELLYHVSDPNQTQQIDPTDILRVIDDLRSPLELMRYTYRIANAVSRKEYDVAMARFPGEPNKALGCLIFKFLREASRPGSDPFHVAIWIADGVGLSTEERKTTSLPTFEKRDCYQDQCNAVVRALDKNVVCALIGPPCSGKSRALGLLKQTYPHHTQLNVGSYSHATALARDVQKAYDQGTTLVVLDEADLLDLRGVLPMPPAGCKLVIAGNGLHDDRVPLPDGIPLVRFPEVLYSDDLKERFIEPALAHVRALGPQWVHESYLKDNKLSGSQSVIMSMTHTLLAAHRIACSLDRTGRVTPRLLQEVFRRLDAVVDQRWRRDAFHYLLVEIIFQVYFDGFSRSIRESIKPLLGGAFYSLIRPIAQANVADGHHAYQKFSGRSDEAERIVNHLWVIQQAQQRPLNPAIYGTPSSLSIEGPPGIGKDVMSRWACECLSLDWAQVEGGGNMPLDDAKDKMRRHDVVLASEMNTVDPAMLHGALYSVERRDERLPVLVTLDNPAGLHGGRSDRNAAAASRTVRVQLSSENDCESLVVAVGWSRRDEASHSCTWSKTTNSKLSDAGSMLQMTYRQMLQTVADDDGASEIQHLQAYTDAVIQTHRSTNVRPSQNKSDADTIQHLEMLAGIPVRFVEQSLSSHIENGVLFISLAEVNSESLCMATRLGLLDLYNDESLLIFRFWLEGMCSDEAMMPNEKIFHLLDFLAQDNQKDPEHDAYDMFVYRASMWTKTDILSRSTSSCKAFGYYLREVFACAYEMIKNPTSVFDPYVLMSQREIDALQARVNPLAQIALPPKPSPNTSASALPRVIIVPQQQDTSQTLPAPSLDIMAPKKRPLDVGLRSATETMYCPGFVQTLDGHCHPYPVAVPYDDDRCEEIDAHTLSPLPGETMLSLRVPYGVCVSDCIWVLPDQSHVDAPLSSSVVPTVHSSCYGVDVPDDLPPGAYLSYRLLKGQSAAPPYYYPGTAVHNGEIVWSELSQGRSDLVSQFIRDMQGRIWETHDALIKHVCAWIHDNFQYRWSHQGGATTGIGMLETGSGNCAAAQELAICLLYYAGRPDVLKVNGHLLSGDKLTSDGHAWLEYMGQIYDPTPSILHATEIVPAREDPRALREHQPLPHKEDAPTLHVDVRSVTTQSLASVQVREKDDPKRRQRWMASECLFKQTVQARSVMDPYGDELKISIDGSMIPCTRAGKVAPKPHVLFIGTQDAVRMKEDPCGLWLPALAVFFEEGHGRMVVGRTLADGTRDVVCVSTLEELWGALRDMPSAQQAATLLTSEEEMTIAMRAGVVLHNTHALSLDALEREGLRTSASLFKPITSQEPKGRRTRSQSVGGDTPRTQPVPGIPRMASET